MAATAMWVAAGAAVVVVVAVGVWWVRQRGRKAGVGGAAGLAASLFGGSPVPLPPPGTRVFTPTELEHYNGADAERPLYLAVKGTVFDVSEKRGMYGPGQSYHVFTGRDASRALGMSSLNRADCVADYSTLTPKQRKTLDDWEAYYRRRYPIVGTVSAPAST